MDLTLDKRWWKVNEPEDGSIKKSCDLKKWEKENKKN